MEKIFIVLSWLVFASLAMGIARQLSEQVTLDKLEPFMNLRPADIVPDMRKPYDLMESLEHSNDPTLTAKGCYDKDFLAQSAKTGNYIQRTNNFPHATPDSCSAPLTEMLFYKNP